jgi:predicted transcriptional regulator
MYYVAVSLSKAGPMTITTVRLPPEIEADLSAVANQLNRTKSWVINQALREFLARQVLEQARWQETLLAMESVAKGKLVAEEAVLTWLASWGTAGELPPPKAG